MLEHLETRISERSGGRELWSRHPRCAEETARSHGPQVVKHTRYSAFPSAHHATVYVSMWKQYTRGKGLSFLIRGAIHPSSGAPFCRARPADVLTPVVLGEPIPAYAAPCQPCKHPKGRAFSVGLDCGTKPSPHIEAGGTPEPIADVDHVLKSTGAVSTSGRGAQCFLTGTHPGDLAVTTGDSNSLSASPGRR